MICKNCGTPFDDSARVCPVCGKIVESRVTPPVDEPVMTPAEPQADLVTERASGISDDTTSNAVDQETPPVQEKTKKPFKLPLPLIIAASVALVVVILIAACWTQLANGIAKLVMPAQDYYAHVEKENVESLATIIYANSIGSASNDFKEGYKGTVKVEIGEKMIDLYEYADLEDALEWLENMEISFESNTSLDISEIDFKGKLNTKKILSGEIIVDNTDGRMIFTSPELDNEYFEIPLALIDNGYDNEFLGEYSEIIEQFGSAIPSEKVATKLLVKYFETIIENMDNADKDSGKLKVGGISQKCTVITIKINGEDAINALVEVLNDAKSDKEIKTIIRDVAEAIEEDPNDTYDMFIERIDSLLDELEDIDKETANSYFPKITLKAWVDNKGNVIGRKITCAGTEMLMATATKGSKIATEAYLKSGSGYTVYKFSGDGKKSIAGKITGEYKLEVRGEKLLNIDVKKYNPDKAKNGYLNGEFYITPGKNFDITDYIDDIPSIASSLLDDITIGIIASTGKNNTNLEIIVLDDDEEYLTLMVDVNNTRYSNPKIPSESKINSLEDENDWEMLVESIDFDAIISRLEKANVPDEIIEYLEDVEDSIR